MFQPPAIGRRLRPSSPAPGLVPLAIALSIAVAIAGVQPTAAQADDGILTISDFYDDWAAAVDPALVPEERRQWHALRTDGERERFVHAFWAGRDWPAGTDADAFLVEWWHRFVETRRRFEDFTGDRARVLMAFGVPDDVQVYGGCRGIVRPLRTWHYNRWQARALGQSEAFYVVFARDYHARDGLFRQWSPADGIGALAENDAPHSRRSIEQILAYSRDQRCFRTGEQEARIFEAALRSALDPSTLDTFRPAPPPRSLAMGTEAASPWPLAFAGRLAPASRPPLPIHEVAVGYPGRAGRKTLVLGRIEVPARLLGRGAAGQLFDRLVLRGEVRLGRHLVDDFTHVFHLAGGAPSDPEARLALDFYRRLRPAPYVVHLRLEDARGLALLRRNLELEVPAVETEISLDSVPVAGGTGDGAEGARSPAGGGSVADLSRKDVVSLLTFPSLELRHPGESLVGEVEIEAVSTGAIEAVRFEVDGQEAGVDDEAPYAVRVDLGERPVAHELVAIAEGPGGRELARDRLHLDPADRPFAVRLQVDAGKVEARVRVPNGERLESLELSLGSRPFARFGPQKEAPAEPTPTFVAELPAERPAGVGYVRAGARLGSGERTEALALLDAGRMVESIDVRLVEVYTTVLDGAGRPRTGLVADDFTLYEDDQPQPLVRFDAVADLPIQVVLAMDTSVSMRERLGLASASARRFFATVLGEGDRAALLTFDHDIRLAVPFTGDPERLSLGTSGLRAWGGTRLNDTLVYAANYFGGHEGRRALVLLSDGRDVGSRFDLESVEEEVLRAGIAVYPILLAVSDTATREGLDRLARESGGRAFTIRSAAQLDGVYARIEEELRSQYLLVFQSPPGNPDFRRLRVETKTPDLRCRSIRGYWP